jgi:8-oxo-dGTP diphosphatase
VIEAAGGVLWRDGGAGREFAVIHRPKYDDWTLPKGKLEEGETHEQAAVREVGEETGYQVELGSRLGAIGYLHRARPKRVEYWGMRAVDGTFVGNREVDELRWLHLDAARRLLTYERDRDVLDRFVEQLTAG